LDAHAGPRGSGNHYLEESVRADRERRHFFNWINSIQTNRVDKRTSTSGYAYEEGNAVISWKVINAFPTKLDGPAFSPVRTMPPSRV